MRDAHKTHPHPFEKILEFVELRDMKFDENNIDKFISVYEEVHGEKITQDEATIMLRKLVHLYQVIGRPLPNEDRETTPFS